MPAPSRPPSRPKPRKRISAASGNLAIPSGVLNPSIAAPSADEIVQLPLTGPIPLVERLAQFWLFGVAMMGLWGGLFYIAFTQGETNERFLMLGIGGLATASAFIWVVERQRRSHGKLATMHDYLLGMGLFFGAAGLFWFLRWGMAFAADPDRLGFSWLVDDARPFADEEWVPGSMGIVVHAAAAVLLGIASWWYLKIKETGTGILSWFVAAITPFGLLIVGLGTWIDWSNGGVSYELGISLVVLSILGMWIGIQSNRTLVFSVVAVLASFMPIIYELVNDGTGSALSLMVFIIFAQGLLAISPQLKDAQAIIERASLGLVAAALIAMAWMTGGDLTMHLGPLKLGPEDWLSGAAVLWLSLLFGYFGAVHMKRVPWMPIGLAFALFLIPHPSNQAAWALTLIMLPYLLWKPDSRKWVRQATFCSAAFAFLVVDWMSHAQHNSGMEFWGTIETNLIHVIPLALLAIGEWARRIERISGNAFRVAMVLVVLSPSMLIEANNTVPWAFSAYLLVVAAEATSKPAEGLQQRKDASMTILTSLGLTTMLAAFGRLELNWSFMPELEGFNLVLVIIAAVYYALGKNSKVEELDIGHFNSWAVKSGAQTPVFNPESGILTVPAVEEEDPENPEWLGKGWGSFARVSLIGPLILFGIALASVNGSALLEEWWIILLAVPVALMIWELNKEEEGPAESRAIAAWALFLMALPLSMQLSNELFNVDRADRILDKSRLLFDLILISGPVAVHLTLQKRGLQDSEKSRNADIASLIGLLALAILDTTGGLVYFTMFAIVAHRTWQHRMSLLAVLAPLTLPLMGTRPAIAGGILKEMIAEGAIFDILLTQGEMLDFDVSRIVGWFGAAFSLLMLSRIIQDRRNPPEHDDERLPFIWSSFVLIVSLQALMVHSSYLLLILTTLIIILGWLAGRTEVFVFAPWAYVIAFPPALADTFPELNGSEIFSYSLLLSGLMTMLFSMLARNKSLFMYVETVAFTEEMEGSRNLMKHKTSADREYVQRYLYWSGLALFFLSFDVLYGISSVLAAIWVTYDSYKTGSKKIFLITPLFHALALANVERIATWDLGIHHIGGWVLVIDGIIFSLLSWKQWYPQWEWSEDGVEYWRWNDQMGMLGVVFFSIGVWWSTFDFSALMVALIIIVYGGLMVAIDPESAWRRAMGIASSTVGGFIALVDPDTTMGGIVMILAGLAAFIQAAMYFQRWGVGMGEITSEGGPEILAAPVVDEEEPIEEEPIESEAIVESEESAVEEELTDDEMDDMLDEFEEELEEESIPEPTLTPDEDDTPAGEEVLDMSEMSNECTAQVIDLMNGLVDVKGVGKVKLNDSMATKIRSALLNTDFSGYIPKVDFDQNGRAVLSFAPDSSLS
jgi:hypothetical protein